MLYNWHIIGERIRKCRKETTIDNKPLTQEQLAEAISKITKKPLKRQTVAAWENGKPVGKLEQLIAMCDIFECEIGYLLCEEGYARKTRSAIELEKKTGLSEESIKTLLRISADSASKVFINDLLSDNSELKHLSRLYKEFLETLNYDEMEEIGILPFSSPPGEHCSELCAYEAKDLALYRFNESVISFARKHAKTYY